MSVLRTALPPAAHMGLAPNVLKWMRSFMTAAISGVVTTAARGRPLPMPCKTIILFACNAKVKG